VNEPVNEPVNKPVIPVDTKEELIQKIKAGKVIIRHDDTWRYPETGDDQKKCPMLDFMFNIEYTSGTLMFVPDEINKAQRGKV